MSTMMKFLGMTPTIFPELFITGKVEKPDWSNLVKYVTAIIPSTVVGLWDIIWKAVVSRWLFGQ